MSLINDALKQARKAPPRSTPSALPPLQPVAREPSSLPEWILPSIVVVLVVAAIFFIGWAVANHSMRTIVAAPPSEVETQQVANVTIPVIKPHVEEPPPAPAPPDAPKLQGIFYSPTTPSAIIDGKIVRPGQQFGQYKVKAISKYTVTLIGPDKKDFQIGMEN
jgi:hypothetical protein